MNNISFNQEATLCKHLKYLVVKQVNPGHLESFITDLLCHIFLEIMVYKRHAHVLFRKKFSV